MDYYEHCDNFKTCKYLQCKGTEIGEIGYSDSRLSNKCLQRRYFSNNVKRSSEIHALNYKQCSVFTSKHTSFIYF